MNLSIQNSLIPIFATSLHMTYPNQRVNRRKMWRKKSHKGEKTNTTKITAQIYLNLSILIGMKITMMINDLIHEQLDTLLLDAKSFFKCLQSNTTQKLSIWLSKFNMFIKYWYTMWMESQGMNKELLWISLKFGLPIITIHCHCPAAPFLLPFQLLQGQSF